MKNPANRRKQALTTWIVGGLFAVVALYIISAAQQRPGRWGLALILTVIVSLVGWGAVWLSQRSQVPFVDETSAEAKAKQIEDLKQQLVSSGRFGRAALRIIGRLASPRVSGDFRKDNSPPPTTRI